MPDHGASVLFGPTVRIWSLASQLLPKSGLHTAIFRLLKVRSEI